MQTWRERNAAARDRGYYTKAEKGMARSWYTCAVGEQHQLHPQIVVLTRMMDCPDDTRLYELGGPDGFCLAVQNDDHDLADVILDQIEDRVLEMKREKAS